MRIRLLVVVMFVLGAFSAGFAQKRWTPEQANAWYAKQPWLVGANFIPSDAINQLEMFQAATFNPAINDRELGLAEAIGMNTMRVFLQDQLWEQDPEGFKKRLDTFLGIAAKHHIRPLLVLFDSCWETDPKLGPQHPPIPGVHNSGWVQSPGTKGLVDKSYEPKLKAYVTGVVGAFANDDRILGWDVWNEPDNGNDKRFDEAPHKADLVAGLLPKVFAWVRSAHPVQPLTSGVWTGDDWANASKWSAVAKIQLTESDIISFHNYGWPEDFEARIQSLQPLGRPILCTEYMARGAGSTFDGSLPVAKKYHVGAINWGLVAGKTQTYLPWDSWQKPYVLSQPTVWFHEVFRHDGTPYRQAEVDLIRRLTGRGTPSSHPGAE
ncbi:Cellulase (glycosyl hydrolase family 5) [Granulicella pectinivorans]|uniref:Cellulase (Glycosyl hydrolase family 5) n=1 Tax=Granulicella pectinivorans TaxID=474950 RepID=A0A1I6LR33_9BACT|nr:cellulase family glycosylhydrolase [Granulicella pectinivorans]SFS05760.1 Cellulase (glycosyl hydrolase family 5) [Granulicella pectinivorans]